MGWGSTTRYEICSVCCPKLGGPAETENSNSNRVLEVRAQAGVLTMLGLGQQGPGIWLG